MSDESKHVYSLEELVEKIKLDPDKVVYFIEREWISPVEVSSKSFDDQDIQRLQFIMELQNDFAVNDEGIDLILHLVDQFHSLRRVLSSSDQRL